MSEPRFLTTKAGRRLAYHQIAGRGPSVVFLGGLRSDMGGSKALYLQDWAQKSGRAFLRFDYSGHGQSSGRFEDGAIGDWLVDAQEALALTTGAQVLVGSSMGGWIALLLAHAMPDRIAGLVGVAAAPDFTEDGMWAGFDGNQRKQLLEAGQVALKSDYSDDPTIITRRMIEDGRNHLVLRSPLNLPFPTRLLQGTADVDVPPSVALRLLEHASCDDLQLLLVKGADHRFSTPDCLAMIGDALDDVIAKVASR
jgi:pimeloyl-ACP methyl ester carboxylesterase